MANSIIDKLLASASEVKDPSSRGSHFHDPLGVLGDNRPENIVNNLVDRVKSIGGSYNTTPNSSMFDLLKGSNGDGTFEDFLKSLGYGGNNDGGALDHDQANDWNKFVLETMLAYQSELDKRKYNEGLRDEDRQYNSPINQMLRLMATGMSRDAALQMLGGGSGGSSGVPYADSLALAAATDPSQSRLNAAQADAAEAQNKYALANTVFNGIGALIGLTSAGISVATAIPQLKMLKASAYMSKQNLNAYNAVNTVSNGIQALTSGGGAIADAVNGLSNAEDLNKYLTDNAATNPAIQQIVSSPDYQTALGTTLGRQMFNQMWKSRRDSRDEGTLLDEYLRQQKFQSAVMAINVDKASAEMALLGQEQTLNERKIIASAYEIAMLDEQMTFNAETHADRVNMVGSQADAAQYQAGNLRMEYELNEYGFPMLKQTYMNSLQDELNRWAAISDPKILEERKSAWAQSESNKNQALYLESLELNAAGNFAEKYPSLYNLCKAFKAAGINEFLHKAVDAGVKIGTALFLKKL